jgi:hypothetical protein
MSCSGGSAHTEPALHRTRKGVCAPLPRSNFGGFVQGIDLPEDEAEPLAQAIRAMTRVEGLRLPSAVGGRVDATWGLLWACSNIVGLQRLIAPCARAEDLADEGLREALRHLALCCPGLGEVHLGEEGHPNARISDRASGSRSGAMLIRAAWSSANELASAGAPCGGYVAHRVS